MYLKVSLAAFNLVLIYLFEFFIYLFWTNNTLNGLKFMLVKLFGSFYSGSVVIVMRDL